MMTNKEYIKTGSKCPVCEGRQISGAHDNGLEIKNYTTAVQVMSCNECKARWTEMYSLYEYEIISYTDMPALQIEVMKAARKKL